MARLVASEHIEAESGSARVPGRLAAVNEQGEIIGHGFLEVEVVGDVDALGRATTDVRFVIENGQAR